MLSLLHVWTSVFKPFLIHAHTKTCLCQVLAAHTHACVRTNTKGTAYTCAHKHTVSLVACLQLELRNLTLKVVQLFCHSGQHTRSLSLPCIHMFPPVHFYLHVGFASASHPANCCPLLYFYKMMEYQPHLGSINSFFKQHWNKWVPDRDEWEEDWRSRLGLKARGRWLVRSRKQGEKLNKTTRESFVVPTVMCYSQVCGQRAEVGWHRW